MAVESNGHHLETGQWPKHVGKFGTPPLRRSKSGGSLGSFIINGGYTETDIEISVPVDVQENAQDWDVVKVIKTFTIDRLYLKFTSN